MANLTKLAHSDMTAAHTKKSENELAIFCSSTGWHNLYLCYFAVNEKATLGKIWNCFGAAAFADFVFLRCKQN